MARLEDNSKEKLASIEQALLEALNEIGITEVASIQSNTPVKTGNLRRSINYLKPTKDRHILKIFMGSDVVYATKVEFENKSYLRATLKADTKEIQNVLIKHLRSVNK